MGAVYLAERVDDVKTVHQARLNLSALMSQIGRYDRAIEHAIGMTTDAEEPAAAKLPRYVEALSALPPLNRRCLHYLLSFLRLAASNRATFSVGQSSKTQPSVPSGYQKTWV